MICLFFLGVLVVVVVAFTNSHSNSIILNVLLVVCTLTLILGAVHLPERRLEGFPVPRHPGPEHPPVGDTIHINTE